MVYRRSGKVRLFAEKEINEFLEQKNREIFLKIDNENDDYILNVNEEDYINHHSSEALIEPIEFLIDEKYVSTFEEMIPAELFPREFNVCKGKSYRKSIIKVHMRYLGEDRLLNCIPTTRLLWSIDVEVTNKEVQFTIINFRENAEELRKKIDSNIKNIVEQSNNLKKDIENYNTSITSKITNYFQARKQKIISQNGLIESLGIPIRKISTSSTFAVPNVKKIKSINLSKPEVHDVAFKVEPTLDKTVYYEILKIIDDVGKNFERLPSVYSNKKEEDLRDHFLMILEPNFQGSATGETFNKSGKTDILLRYEGENIFIAECKFWRGIKSFEASITQLISYLTWRDSKAAVIIFVKNKEFSSVLDSADKNISNHPNYLRFKDKKNDAWKEYEFHINGDRNRKIRIATMFYHIP